MTGRIIIGQRGTSFGIYVSEPGQDVTTTGEEHLMLSPSKVFMQVIMTRSVALPVIELGTSFRALRRIDHEDFGFVPLAKIEFEVTATPTVQACSRYPFGQTATGFWLALNNDYYDPMNGLHRTIGATITIRIYNIPATSFPAKPAFDVEFPDT